MHELTSTLTLKFVALTALIILGSARATEAEGTPPDHSKYLPTGGPYCGIYSLYAALQSQGINVPFEALAEPKYVGSSSGSSLAELRQAAEDFGANAVPVKGLTVNALRSAKHPVILHVRRPGKDTQYSHWVLYLGTESGEARVLDPPNAVERMPFAEIMSLSDGVGLIVARESPKMWELKYSTWVEWATLLFFLSAGVIAASNVISRRPAQPPRMTPPLLFAFRRGGRVIGLLACAGLLAVAAQTMNSDGFFSNRTAVAYVAGRYFEPPMRDLTCAEVASLADSPNVRIVDARLPAAFHAGHIPGAVNLPVTAGLAERGQVVKSITTSERVIVYCQNDRCPWARSVATDLHCRGVHEVAIFPGGWKEWTEHVGTSARP